MTSYIIYVVWLPILHLTVFTLKCKGLSLLSSIFSSACLPHKTPKVAPLKFEQCTPSSVAATKESISDDVAELSNLSLTLTIHHKDPLQSWLFKYGHVQGTKAGTNRRNWRFGAPRSNKSDSRHVATLVHSDLTAFKASQSLPEQPESLMALPPTRNCISQAASSDPDVGLSLGSPTLIDKLNDKVQANPPKMFVNSLQAEAADNHYPLVKAKWRIITSFHGKALQKPLEELKYSAVKMRPSIELQFGLMEITFFAAGSHQDQKHGLSRSMFHSAFDTMCAEMENKGHPPTEFNRCRSAHIDGLMDMATLLDWAFGGSTMVMHFTGTLEPGQGIIPEHLKTSVYFSPHMLAEYPDLDAVVAKLNQIFIEEVTVCSAECWKAAAAAKGWSMDGPPTRVIPFPDPRLPLLLPAEKKSSVFIIRGRIAGSLDEPLESIQQHFDSYKHGYHSISAMPLPPITPLVHPTTLTTPSTPLASPHSAGSQPDGSLENSIEGSDAEPLGFYTNLIQSLQGEIGGLQAELKLAQEEHAAELEELTSQYAWELSQMQEEMLKLCQVALKSKLPAEGSSFPTNPRSRSKTLTPTKKIRTANSWASILESDVSLSMGSISGISTVSSLSATKRSNVPLLPPCLPLASSLRLPHIVPPQLPPQGPISHHNSYNVGMGHATHRFAHQNGLVGSHWSEKFQCLARQEPTTWYGELIQELSLDLAAEALLALYEDMEVNGILKVLYQTYQAWPICLITILISLQLFPIVFVDLDTQQCWAWPLVPAYWTACGCGQAILDAYLNGLFVVYHDHFGRSLGMPVDCRDPASVKKWKQRSLDTLVRLMFTAYSNVNLMPAQSMPPSNKPAIDLKSVAKYLESATKDLDKLVADLPPLITSNCPLQMSCDSSVPPTSVASDTTTLLDDRPDDVKAPTLLELLAALREHMYNHCAVSWSYMNQWVELGQVPPNEEEEEQAGL
ncbi:hypothetical protein ARMSODRAFT_982030 [Armillaria solidipes]|uniref:Uncharacterized protein n=1 Tax=Armillaria solidipes TaxID=1076256 RepID=A0A2H3APQ5_9AGAR|nr:hypothetical protein ARMSODRAFT_982030 [Armillaria solidipes]